MRQSLQRTSHADVVAIAIGEPLEARSQRRLGAFARPWRPAIAQLTRGSSAVEDLAESFPALLFALATGYGTDKARADALAAVMHGLPLKEAAGRLGLPFWLRKLPPAALGAPLVSLPTEPQLVSRLLSLIPPQPAIAAAWLERVMIAHHTGRPELTLWVAETYRGRHPVARSASFLGVLAWAWFAGAHPTHRATQLLAERWKPSLGLGRAIKEAALWKERITLAVTLGSGIDDTWIEPGSVGELSFVPLRTVDDMIAEAAVMDNCLDRYGDKLIGRTVRVFSVRRGGHSIADIEIAAHENEPGHPFISQLRGPHNRRAPLEVWRAAYAWLGAQPLRLADASMAIKVGPTIRTRRQEEIWRPFLDVLPDGARAAMDAHAIARPKKRAVRKTAPVPGSTA